MTLKILKICRFRSRKCHLFVQIVTRKDTVLKKDCSHGRDTFAHLLRNAMHPLFPKPFPFQFPFNFLTLSLPPFTALSLPFRYLFSVSRIPYLVFTSYLSRIHLVFQIGGIYKTYTRRIGEKYDKKRRYDSIFSLNGW